MGGATNSQGQVAAINQINKLLSNLPSQGDSGKDGTANLTADAFGVGVGGLYAGMVAAACEAGNLSSPVGWTGIAVNVVVGVAISGGAACQAALGYASMLRAMFDAYNDSKTSAELIFDNNQSWIERMSLLQALYPGSRVICCVREIGWVIDRIERMLAKNPLQLSTHVRFQAGRISLRTFRIAHELGHGAHRTGMEHPARSRVLGQRSALDPDSVRPLRRRLTSDAGRDIATVDTASLHQQIGVVLQEITLLSRSIRDNVVLTAPTAPLKTIITTAKLASTHEFIYELPEGYDMVVGEHGTGLSGGQRQHIVIARARLTNPRVVIFDEATSALDYESEKVIQDNMRSICQGLTVLIIARRLSAVHEANRIIVLERGQIAEIGNHSELFKNPGDIYAHLYALQQGSAL